MANKAYWINLDTLQFVNNLLMTLQPDEPLGIQLRRIFAESVAKLMFYADCDSGIHLFANKLGDKDLEVHALYMDSLAKEYAAEALRHRQPPWTTCVLPNILPCYVRTHVEGREGHSLIADLKSCLDPCNLYFVRTQGSRIWCDLFRDISTGGTASAGRPMIECPAGEVLVIRLRRSNETNADQRLIAGLLGTVVLWNRDGQPLASTRTERIIPAAKTISDFAFRYFKTHHSIEEATYLPSYRTPGPRTVAIVFADIRNFTACSEILRNFNLAHLWTTYIRDYTAAMCEVVNQMGGRVQSITGDGIMAIFGEYSTDREGTAKSATRAATEMLRRFEAVKIDFFNKAEITKFTNEKYEPLEFGIGIGVNFGDVLFDYFGADGSRVYGATGDNVNFAQRLESAAGRFDPHTRKERAPILVSRPVWQLVGAPGDWLPVVLEVEGKPYRYRAYECNVGTTQAPQQGGASSD
jgi:class 3 adenylate cyclase